MSDRQHDLLDADVDYPPGWTPVTPRTELRSHREGRRRWSIAMIALVVLSAVASALTVWNAWHLSTNAAQRSAESSSAQRNTLPASSEDRGPMAVVTSDVTCGRWGEVRAPVVAAQGNGWAKRDPQQPRQAWDPLRRKQFETMAAALRTAADQTAPLTRETPHRGMRELYQAFVSYGRGYADSVSSYQPADDMLARTAMGAFDALTNICTAANGSSRAILRAQVVPQAAPPTAAPRLGDADHPERFLAGPVPPCREWVPRDAALRAQTTDWSSIDPKLAREQWNPAQRAVIERTAHVASGRAVEMESSGRAADNAVFADLAVLGAQYFRAYDLGVPNYRPGDDAYARVGFAIHGLITAACQTPGT